MNKKVFYFIRNFLVKLRVWLLTPVPRWRTIVATVAFIAIMTVSLLYGGDKISAATYSWTQTNWATLTANNTGHPAPANWTEYSAKDTNFTTINAGADLQLTSAPTVNEYTIGALANINVDATAVTDNSNGTWTITLGAADLSRIFKNDIFKDEASPQKSWKILSSFDSANKIIVWDSEGNGVAPSAAGLVQATVGRWYASISLWEAGREGNLVTRNAIERGLPYYDGAADTTAVVIDGWTTDATHYIEIYVPLSERHRGKWDSSKYYMELTNARAITINVSNVRIDGLQISLLGATGGKSGIYSLAALNNIGVYNNIIKDAGLAGTQRAVYLNNTTNTDIKIWNNIFYDFNGGSGTSQAIYIVSASGGTFVYNNNVINSSQCFVIGSGGSSGVIAKNNIAQGCTDGFLGTFHASSSNNISDLASDAPGANSKNSTTVPFVDSTNKDFHLEFRDGAGNPAMNAGADLSADANLAFTTDIDQDTRSGTWDIGADDVGAALVKVHSIGTAARNFATLQGWEDARDGVLTTRNVFKISTQSAAFTEGETITGTSGATGTYIKERDTPSASETYMTVDKVNATAFVAGETVTGTGGSTAVISTILTTAGTIERGEGYNDGTPDASMISIAGWTTNATHYPHIYVPHSQRHQGTVDSGGYLLRSTSGAATHNLTVNANYTILEGLKIERTSSNSAGWVAIKIGTAYGQGQFITIRNNLLVQSSGGGASGYDGLISQSGGNTESDGAKVYNNIIVSNSNSLYCGISFIKQFDLTSSQQSKYYNNTVYGSFVTAGFCLAPGSNSNDIYKPLLSNNYIANIGSGVDFGLTNYSNTLSNFSYNRSDDTTAGTSNNNAQLTVTNAQFVDSTIATADLHILHSSPLKDAGTSLSSTFTTDIDGQTRPVGSSWDIGADEHYPVYQYPSSQTLTSSAYDSTDAANVIGSLSWTEDTSLPTGTTVTVSLRTATSSANLASASWNDFTNATTNCSKTTGVVTCPLAAIPAALKDGTGDQWFQYKVTLTSTGANTPTFSDITLQYVVNAPPDFNPSGGLTVSQVSDSADANWGKVRIDYSVRDTDTSSGTTDPGFVTPSFQYNIGGGLVTINSTKLSTDATLHKAVNGSTYTTYTAYWDAQTDIANNYLTTAQIKVTVNDLEAANNTASSTSSNFTLDTKVPTVSAFKIDSTLDQLTLTSADDSVLQYRISNSADLSADGLNGTSGAWQSPAVNSISLTPSWIFTGAPSYETAYLQVRDVLGNVSSATAVAPSTSVNMYIQDISNVGSTTYKEFISWSVFVPAAGSAFSSYQVYRSTDGSSYSLLATVSSVSTNYYVDSAVSLDATYYYKVRVADTDTDIGNYGAVVSDKVDGQGGSDTTAPNITSVTVTEQQATYATITWTTDELANSEVDYSISPSTAFGTASIVSSYVTSHSVTITNLTPNTTYLFRVKSTDVLGNVATNNNSGAGFTIVTIGGPIISNVTETEVNEHSATIFWNTNTNSDSHVSYSISSSLSSPTRAPSGASSLVGGPPYQHKVSISGLTSGTKYYYFVESTDASSNNSKETNGNSYYSFTTTSDAKAPVISAVSVPVSALTAAVVIWNTDEVATGIVDYGTTSGTYSSSTTLDSTLTIFHIGSLSSLTENTKYYYRVRSTDNAGNEATSAEYNFTTDQTHVVISGGGGSVATPPVVLDTTPPVITNIATKDIKSFSATIGFDTSEDSVGFVNYGVDPAELNLTSGDSAYSQNHQIKLSGLIMGKKYSFVVKAVDKSGNIATSPIGDLTTKFFTESSIQLKDTEAFQKEIEDAIESALPSLVAPFIEKPQIINITDNSATATWRTNVKSYGSVVYADDSTYDEKRDNPYLTEITDTLSKVVEHKIDLPNLKPDTRYHIMARSFSLPEVVGKSKDLTFITEALKIKANIGNITNNSFKAVWTTSEPTTSIVEYRNMKTGELNQKSSDAKTVAHEILVNNLTPGTSYTVNVFGYNEKGNKISIASSIMIKTSIDTTTPTITSLMIDSALIPGRNDRAQTIVSWKTDEPSTSAVFFKEGASSPDEKLTNKVEMTNSFVINHAVVVSSLKPGGLYSIQVSSTDAAGNTALFPIRTALVPEQSQSVIEIIFKNFEDTFRFLRQ